MGVVLTKRVVQRKEKRGHKHERRERVVFASTDCLRTSSGISLANSHHAGPLPRWTVHRTTHEDESYSLTEARQRERETPNLSISADRFKLTV